MSTASPPPTPGATGDPSAARAAETPFSPDGELGLDEPLVKPVGGEAIEREREMLREINARPLAGRLAGYVRLSGPGWLQSALTLGGGSLAGGLYLGVIAGFGLLWLQPVAMILGICMLSAIGYVTLSTGLRPFRAINQHVNPALGWLWLAASGLANVVWALPQYSLATGALQQNLMPDLLGGGGGLSDTAAKLLIAGVILVISVAVTWSYGSGHWGVRVYEVMLKVVVGLIVACFIGVVARLAWEGELDWGAVFAGFVPDFGAIFRPAPALQALVDALPDAASRDYWSNVIVGSQRDKMMAAFATAVGINMTFLLPYSMLGRGWGREHRGLGIFDLATGMFIPFLLATSCVVIASASQFHGSPKADVPVADAGYAALLEKPEGELTKSEKAFLKNVDGRGVDRASLPENERVLAAALVERDADALASSLTPVFGGGRFADVVFGLGVLGMACSTITLLMLVSGFVVCEVLNVPATGWNFRLGALLPCLGALGPFYWSGAAVYLAVPTSVFGLTLLPVAYLTFLLLMNRRELLGDAMPTGGKRIAVNLVLGTATLVAFFAAAWAIRDSTFLGMTFGWPGLIAVAVAFAVALAVGEVVKRRSAAA
ncbi:divalent metal cation transporter [Alienimonas sp. DA493]|uniref:divalent metal cation transporter n=1 Tax=Alienimonas sp. DA493 TaxID=3373605 RepID=UPI003754A3E0